LGLGRRARRRSGRRGLGRWSFRLLRAGRVGRAGSRALLSTRAHVDGPPPKDETSKPSALRVAHDDGSMRAGAPAGVGRGATGFPVVLAKKRATAARDVIQRRPTRMDSSRTRTPSGPGRPLVTQRHAACRASGFPDRDGGSNAASERTGTRRSATSVAASASWLLMTRRCRRVEHPNLSRLGSHYVVPILALVPRVSTLRCRIWCDAKRHRAPSRSIPLPSSRA